MACKRDEFADFWVYHVFVEEGRLPGTLFVPSQNKTKMCRARGAEDWFIFLSLYFTLPFFCCSKRWAAPIGHLSSFLSSQAWLLAYLRYGSTLEPQLPQFNPNLKDKPYSFMFFFYYDTLQFGQIVVFGCPARDNFVRTGMLEIPTWNP